MFHVSGVAHSLSLRTGAEAKTEVAAAEDKVFKAKAEVTAAMRSPWPRPSHAK